MGFFNFFRRTPKPSTGTTAKTSNAYRGGGLQEPGKGRGHGSGDHRSAGHPMDDRLLEILESQAGADLSLARDWIHYSYFPDETSARAALAECEAAGWTCVNDVWQTDDGAWSVSVARLDTPVNHSTVPKARVFFEELTERLGGEYDGWECAVEPSGE